MGVKIGAIPFLFGCLVFVGSFQGGYSYRLSVREGTSRDATSSAALRLIRAAKGDGFDLALENMQELGRMVTGISVQAAINAGTLKTDPFISELLGLGNVTPTEIASIDGVKLQDAMATMRELPDTLVYNEEISKIEEKLKKVEEVRKMVEKIGDGKQWNGKKTFQDEMDFVGNKMNLSAFDTAKTPIENALSDAGRLPETVEATQLVRIKGFIAGVKDEIDKIRKSIGGLSQLNKKSWGYPNVESAEAGLEPLILVVQTVKKAYGYMDSIGGQIGGDDNVFQSNLNNIKTLSTVSEKMSGVAGDLKKVEHVVKSRGSSNTKNLMYPGFSNGSADIDRLFSDLFYGWLSGIFNAEEIVHFVNPLKTLLKDFKQVDKDFGHHGVKKEKIYSQYLELVEDVRAVPSDVTQITGAFGEFWQCKQLFTGFDKPANKAIKDFVTEAKKLDTEMSKLAGKIEKFKSILQAKNTTELLGSVEKLCVTSDKVAELQAIVDTFKNSKKVTNLFTVLNEAKTAYSDIDSAARQAQAMARTISQKVDTVDRYFTSLNKYHTLFSCLHKFGEQKAKLITDGIDISQKFSKFEDEESMVRDGEEVVNRVIDSIEGLKELSTAIGNMKNKGKPIDVPVAAKHSKVLGTAVNGFIAMAKALANRKHAQVIIQNSGIVADQMQTAQLDQIDKDQLNAVVQLKTSLETMYQQLDNWKKRVAGGDFKLLKDYSPIFSNAKSVTGVQGDLILMSKSVGELVNTVTDRNVKKQLRAVKQALLTLGPLDMDFASYRTQFDASQDSLNALQLYFTNHKLEPDEVDNDFTHCDDCGECEDCKDEFVGDDLVGLYVLSSFNIVPVSMFLAVCFFVVKKRVVQRWVKKRRAEKKSKKTNEHGMFLPPAPLRPAESPAAVSLFAEENKIIEFNVPSPPSIVVNNEMKKELMEQQANLQKLRAHVKKTTAQHKSDVRTSKFVKKGPIYIPNKPDVPPPATDLPDNVELPDLQYDPKNNEIYDIGSDVDDIELEPSTSAMGTVTVEDEATRKDRTKGTPSKPKKATEPKSPVSKGE